MVCITSATYATIIKEVKVSTLNKDTKVRRPIILLPLLDYNRNICQQSSEGEFFNVF